MNFYNLKFQRLFPFFLRYFSSPFPTFSGNWQIWRFELFYHFFWFFGPVRFWHLCFIYDLITYTTQIFQSIFIFICQIAIYLLFFYSFLGFLLFFRWFSRLLVLSELYDLSGGSRKFSIFLPAFIAFFGCMSANKDKRLSVLKFFNFLRSHFGKPNSCVHGQIGSTIILTGSNYNEIVWNFVWF